MTVTLRAFGDRASKICMQALPYKDRGICHRGRAPEHAIPAPATRARFLSDFPQRIGGKAAVV